MKQALHYPATALTCLLLGVLSLSAQIVVRDFKLPQYYETHELAPGGTNRLKSLLIGKQARMLTNGLTLVNDPWIGRFGKSGETNLVALSPECLLDPRRDLVFSTNALRLTSGDNQMRLAGRGFLCRMTNFNLFLSNEVKTVIRRDLAQTARGPGQSGKAPVTPFSAATNASNAFVTIYADWANLNYQSNRATYRGRVRVEDPPLELHSERLTIYLTTNNAIDRIVAQDRVSLTNHLDHSLATGDEAVYRMGPDTEWLTLRGEPAYWQDPERAAKARRLTYDLRQQSMRAEQQAWLKLPRVAMAGGDWLLSRPEAKPSVLPGTNAFVEISAEVLLSQLPTTNRPGRSLTAHTNVVILSPSDQSRAAGDEARYNETTGTLELLGRASWQRDQRLVKGERLFFDRGNQVFRANGNAYLKVPMSELGKQNVLGASARGNHPATAPQFLEATSDRYEYQNGFLTFWKDVHGRFLEGETNRGTLECGWLQIKLSNQVERVVAEHQVTLDQLPAANDAGALVSKKLKCEFLSLDLGANGQVRYAVARTNVAGHKTELRPGQAKPIFSWLSAEQVTADFFTHTNQVREMVAERNVFMMHEDRSATGERAVYNATNNLVVMTGNPVAQTPQIKNLKAETMVWDRTHNRFFFESPKGTAIVPSGGTNQNRAPRVEAPATNAPPKRLPAKPARVQPRPWR